MSDNSPLFVSAIELLAHSTELYTQGNERKHKFVILHLANAIELILKDRLVDKGISIYVPKQQPKTITIWKSFDELERVNVNVPERPVIELLIDDRNTIQHRFGFPDSATVYFYLKQVIAFFKRFFDEEYGVDLAEVLKDHLLKEDLAILGLVEEEGEYAQLDKLFDLSPESAVLQAYNLVESRFWEAMEIAFNSRQGRHFIFWRDSDFPHLLDDLAIDGFISQDTARKFHSLREVRNRAAHTAHFQEDESSSDWAEALGTAKDLLSGLDKAIQEDYFSKRSIKGSVAGNSNNTEGTAQVAGEAKSKN